MVEEEEHEKFQKGLKNYVLKKKENLGKFFRTNVT